MKHYSTIIRLGVLSIAATLVIGCHEDGKPQLSINDAFVDDSQPRTVNNYFDRQAEIGARDDAMLYEGHFTGTELNSLGVAKLNRITAGSHKDVTTVYLDVPRNADYGPRELAINTYMNGKGIGQDAFKVVAGPNLGKGTPAAIGLDGLTRQSVSGATAADSATTK